MQAAAVTLEVPTPDDWEVWREIRLRALRADPDAFGSTAAREEQLTEDRWRAWLRRDRLVLARLAGAPVGMGGSVADAPGWHRVVALWVAPEVRGRGVGRAVLDDVVAAALATGCRVRLSVADGSPARRLYERAGFVGTGARTALREGSARAKEQLVLERRPGPLS